MTTAGLKVFDETVHLTNTWLNELQRDLDLESKQQAYHILRVVLHHLRDMLPVNNAIHLSAQLPMLVRGFYLENWRPGAKTPHPKTREAFLDAVSEDFMPGPDISAASAVKLLARLEWVIMDMFVYGLLPVIWCRGQSGTQRGMPMVF